MARTNFKNLRVYRLAEKLAYEVWEIVMGWSGFARCTVGERLVSDADSIGANISEGTERGTFVDNRRFVRLPEAPFMKLNAGFEKLTDENFLRGNKSTPSGISLMSQRRH